MRTSAAETAPAGSSVGSREHRLAGLALALGAAVYLLTAWAHDDAYITFRSIDNLLHGLGLRWNPAERVQVFTHPLWMLLHVPLLAATGAPYLSTLALSFSFSVATLWWVALRVSPDRASGALLVVTLLLSEAWVDYASSGLEDPLTRLLIVLLAAALLRDGDEPGRGATRGGVSPVALLAALGALSRPDAFLLFLPALATRFLRAVGPRRWAGLALGLLPLALWAGFALVYFGSVLPNTALAKLGAGVPWQGRVVQGFVFLGHSLVRDPLTPIAAIGGAVWALRARRSPLRPLAWGALLYLSYVTWIGADYTLGRFLGAPLMCSLLALSRSVDLPALVSRAPRRWAAVVAAMLLLRIGTPWLERPISSYGIGDERRIYSPFTGLVNGAVAAVADPGGPWPDHFWRIDGLTTRERGAAVEVFGYVGFYGYYAGPQVHIVDPHALTDPLLARLPGYVTETFNLPDRVDWRPGHLTRAIPPGYLETLRTGVPAFEEPELRELWRMLELAHRAPLFAPGRAKALVGLALGSYREDLRAYVERHTEQFGIARP